MYKDDVDKIITEFKGKSRGVHNSTSQAIKIKPQYAHIIDCADR